MEFITINRTTLSDIDSLGEVRIEICCGSSKVEAVDYVSFEKLEKWVASVRKQIIKSSNEQAKDCQICNDWDSAYGGACANCGRNLPSVG